jgi:hypothetical protein
MKDSQFALRQGGLNPYNLGGSILRFFDCNYVDSDPEHGLGYLYTVRDYGLNARK